MGVSAESWLNNKRSCAIQNQDDEVKVFKFPDFPPNGFLSDTRVDNNLLP